MSTVSTERGWLWDISGTQYKRMWVISHIDLAVCRIGIYVRGVIGDNLKGYKMEEVKLFLRLKLMILFP